MLAELPSSFQPAQEANGSSSPIISGSALEESAWISCWQQRRRGDHTPAGPAPTLGPSAASVFSHFLFFSRQQLDFLASQQVVGSNPTGRLRLTAPGQTSFLNVSVATPQITELPLWC